MTLNDIIIGTCSICGGPVVVPYVWWGVNPPEAGCDRCGAVRNGGYGPTIPMRQPGHWTTTKYGS